MGSTSSRRPPANVTWHTGRISRDDRWSSLGTTGGTIWMTGLSGSGKSTVASAVEQHFVKAGRSAYRLDGDNLRTGLNSDLEFSRADREENIRRVGEVAWLFADSGVIAIVALISPFQSSRDAVRALHASAGLPFIEVYMAAPVDVCATRDPKGLYARASKGSIASFTGLDDPYEPPESPDLELSSDVGIGQAAEEVLRCFDARTVELIGEVPADQEGRGKVPAS
jgi:adenylyl-sulfate kinase